MKRAKLGLLDRATDFILSVASPRRLSFRQHVRRLDSDSEYRSNWLALLNARGYRNAGVSGSKTPWMGGNRSADSEISNDLPALRSRSREVNRDDPIGSGLTETFENNVIGSGQVAQAQTRVPEKDKLLEEVWAERKDELYPVDDLTFEEAQQLAFRKVFEDGDVLINRVVPSPGEPLWFEVIEADRLVTPLGMGVVKVGDGRREIRDGVERDSFGRPSRYWILKHHPGDTFSTGAALDKDRFTGVPKENIRHLKITKRPGQTRGVPAFHAILQDLRDLDLLIIASLKRVQVAACFALIIESPEIAEGLTEDTAKKYGYKLEQQIEPGMIFKAYPGEVINTVIPNFPTPELGPFIITLARRIGAALGVTWQIVLKDFSEANYSSARTDLLEARQGPYMTLQRWFAKKALTWQWVQVMEDAFLRGDPRLAGMTRADFKKVSWTANGWSWVDPQREARATEIELRIGATTLRDVGAARGQDWEEVMEQRLREEAKERDLRVQFKLPPKGEVLDSSGNGNASGNGNGRGILVDGDGDRFVHVTGDEILKHALGDGDASHS